MIASTRLKRHGTKVIEGDLVKVYSQRETPTDNAFPPPSAVDCEQEPAQPPKGRYEIKVQMQHSFCDTCCDGDLQHSFCDTQFVTKEDVEDGKYAIEDVVLPLPGDKVSGVVPTS